MASLTKSISEHCTGCSYDKEAEGGWKKQVHNCKGVSCKLYPVRPLQMGHKHEVRSSRRAAVDEQCKSCIYEQGEKGTWRAQVARCKSTDCALYEVRPMPSNNIEIEEIS